MIFPESKEAITLLLESSRKAIPFNIILASLLALDLALQHVPYHLIIAWWFAILVISLVRFMFCKYSMKNYLYENKVKFNYLKTFIGLTLLMGITWDLCYFISINYLSALHEFIIILVFGGMCAGAIASLSICLPAYYAYVLPMLLPVIIYNYSLLDLDRSILATMTLLFIIMLMVSAGINKRLLVKTFELTHDLEVMSITDPLTGLFNRRHYEIMLPKELSRAKRNQHSLNLISIDVDNFKLINDNFGHPYGDKFLINIGKTLSSVLQRSNDILFRIGGDEFTAILVNQSPKEATAICNLLNERLKDNPFYKNDLNTKQQLIMDQVTLSIGIVNIHFDHVSNIESVTSTVDKALYQAKKLGKNKIIVKNLH